MTTLIFFMGPAYNVTYSIEHENRFDMSDIFMGHYVGDLLEHAHNNWMIKYYTIYMDIFLMGPLV